MTRHSQRVLSVLICAAGMLSVSLGQPPQPIEPLPPNTAVGDNVQNTGRTDAQRYVLTQLDLKESRIVDAMRMIAEMARLNIIATPEAGEKTITLYLQDITAINAVETVAKLAGLWYREDPRTGAIRVMTVEEYQKDIVFHRDDVTKVFTLLHPNVSSAAQAIQDLYGFRVVLSLAGVSDDDFGGGQGGQGGIGQGGVGAGGLGAVIPGAQGAIGSNFARPGSLPGSGQFARAGGSNPFQQQFGGAGIHANRPSKEPLTAEQIAQIHQRLAAAGEEDLDSELVRKIAQQEPPIYVTINRQHNLVIVRTSDEKAMLEIEKLILAIDRPTPEVLLEMKILELTINDSYRHVLDLKSADSRNINTGAAQTSFLLGSLAQNTIAVGGEPLASGTLVYQYLNNHIRAQIQWFKENNCLHTVATPLILASNNRPARIFVGEERVMTTGVNTNVVTPATGAATTAISPITEIRDIGVTLRIIPKINSDRTVTITVTHESSTLKQGSASLPVAAAGGGVQTFNIDTVDTATLEGTVVAKDGLTVALGGMIRKTTVRDRRKVPVLGDLHVVGHFFTREIDIDEKRELVLLITPHVITTPGEGELKTQWRLNELSNNPQARQAGYGSLYPSDQMTTPTSGSINDGAPVVGAR